MGGGRVGGSCRAVSLAKGSVADERPWSVKGRSRRRPISDGSKPLALSASEVDLRETSLATFFLGVPLAGSGGGGVRVRFVFSAAAEEAAAGSFFRPPAPKASRTAASSSGAATTVDARERRSFSAGRGGPRCWAGGLIGLSGRGSFGSGESDSW